MNPESYFKRAVLKNLESSDGTEHVSYAAAYAAHKRLHEKLGIFINKVLHQGRGQCQRELDELGVQVPYLGIGGGGARTLRCLEGWHTTARSPLHTLTSSVIASVL